MLDLSTLSIEELIGHLRAMDDRTRVTSTPVGSKLLMTEEEWTAKAETLRGRLLQLWW